MTEIISTGRTPQLIINKLLLLLEQQNFSDFKFREQIQKTKTDLEIILGRKPNYTILNKKSKFLLLISRASLQIENEDDDNTRDKINVEVQNLGCRIKKIATKLIAPSLYGEDMNIFFAFGEPNITGESSDDTKLSKQERNTLKFIPNDEYIDNALLTYEAAVNCILYDNIVKRRMSPCIIKFKDVMDCTTADFAKQLEIMSEGDKNKNLWPKIQKQHEDDILSTENFGIIVTEQEQGNLTQLETIIAVATQSDELRPTFEKLCQQAPQVFLYQHYESKIQPVLVSIVFQTLITLLAIQNILPDFRHNNLHADNIIISNIIEDCINKDESSYYLRFILHDGINQETRIYDVPHCGFVAKIAGFRLANLANPPEINNVEDIAPIHSSPNDYENDNNGLTRTPNHFYDYYIFLESCRAFVLPQDNMNIFNLSLFSYFLERTIGFANENLQRFGEYFSIAYQQDKEIATEWPQLVDILKDELFTGYVSDGSRHISENFIFEIDLKK